jgi:hypothetical protein
MKKIVIATVIALAATAASALELGVTTARDYAGDNRNATGVTVGQKLGTVNVTAGFDRATLGTNDQDRYSVVAGRDITKVGPVTVAVKTGVAYLNNQTGANGYAALVGVGASLPVTKTMTLTVDATRQYGQDRVKASDGNRVAVGITHRF